jgi:glycosyltransferase involved in cell wall biosynthesis
MEDLTPAQCSSALIHALDARAPDVVMSGAIAFPSGANAVRWASERRKRVVVFDNARRLDVPRNRLVNFVKRRIYTNVDAMLLPAPSHIPDYEYWGIRRERMFFGVNVVDNAFFAEKAAQARTRVAQKCAELKLPARFLLGVGRQVGKKNWDGLLRAWVRFKTQVSESDLHLVLVGEGPMRMTLEKLAASGGRKDIHFHGFGTAEAVAEMYGLATALILPSRAGETWGLVVNEAMAAGLPVMVSRECGCAATLVKEDENGWTFGAESEAEISNALCALNASSTADRARMGKRSKEIIAEWGLERFCAGAWAAICCAQQWSSNSAGMVDRLILKLWKGRYRPT